MYNKIVKYWVERDKSTEDNLNRILSNFWLLSTCHSNNIEDGKLNYHVTREVFEGSSITVAGVYPADVIEAQNSRFVRCKVVKSLLNKSEITPDLIRDFHKTYMRGLYDDRRYNRGERPGLFKINDYAVGITDEGSAPEDVERDMVNLCDEVVTVDGSKMLTVAAYFHAMFESIHPFSDGNGRIGRLMMNYLLMLNNHPPINIFSEDKETYYMALEVFDRTGELSGFIKFLEEQCVKTWWNIVEKSDKRIAMSISDAIEKMEGKQ